MRRDYSVGRLRAWMCRQAYLSVQGWAVLVLAWTAGCSVDDQVSVLSDAPPAIGDGAGVGRRVLGHSQPARAAHDRWWLLRDVRLRHRGRQVLRRFRGRLWTGGALWRLSDRTAVQENVCVGTTNCLTSV